MRMQSVVEFKTLTRVRAMENRILDVFQPPIPRTQELLLAHPLHTRLHGVKEGTEKVIRRGPRKQRIHPQRALPRRRHRHAQPPLKHAEHTARPGALVVIADGVQAARRLPGIEARQVPAENGVVHPAQPVPVLLPPLDAAAVAVWA